MDFDIGQKIIEDFERNKKNCLFLTDCGLNYEMIVCRMIKKYAINTKIMIVLNVSNENSEYIIDNVLSECIKNKKLNVNILTKKVQKFR